jgi:hypothetical protein
MNVQNLLIPTASPTWPAPIIADFQNGQLSGCVGTRLLSETDRARVWEIRLPPGARLGFHRHVLDYFWTAMTAGKARSYRDDGSVSEVSYFAGETQHSHYAAGEFKVHDLENIGDTELVFATVEFLDSENPPLDLPRQIQPLNPS